MMWPAISIVVTLVSTFIWKWKSTCLKMVLIWESAKLMIKIWMKWVECMKSMVLKQVIVGFADSSLNAFAAVYLRITKENETSVLLFISKSKVSLMKRLTIPR